MNTEDVSQRYQRLDTWPTGEVVAALIEGQMRAPAAVWAVEGHLEAAAEAAAARLAQGGGRIVYAGAGASGRIAVQDGVELHPTYGWPDDRLVYLMAGGEGALVRSVEGAEDDAEEARRRVAELDLGPTDVLIAVAASGATPFVVAAAQAARTAGALVIGLANNPDSPLAAVSDHAVELLTGAEVIAGSTRMAAGTAQKIALNVLSTAIMVRLRRVHDNLMVDLASTNAKLARRRLAILRRIVPADEATAQRALERAGGHIKTAALLLRGCTPEKAGEALARAGGDLRAALATLNTSRTEKGGTP